MALLGFLALGLLVGPWLYLARARRELSTVIGTVLYLSFVLYLFISSLAFRPSQNPNHNPGGLLGYLLGGGLWSLLGGPLAVMVLVGSLVVGVLFVMGGGKLRVYLAEGTKLLSAGLLASLSLGLGQLGRWFRATAGGLLGWAGHLLLWAGVVALLLWTLRPKAVSLPKLKLPKIRLWRRPSRPAPEPKEPEEKEPRIEIRVERREPAETPEAETPEKEPEPFPEPERESVEEEVPLLSGDIPGDELSPEEPRELPEVSYHSPDPRALLALFRDPPARRESGGPEPARIAKLIEEKLREFKVEGRVVGWTRGPVVTRYEYEPAPGVKLTKVVGLADDLALRLKATSVRVVAPLPGKGLIGIEVPNPKRQVVFFKELAGREEFLSSEDPLLFALGVDPGGEPHYQSLGAMPHLLIAGTTGSGKSVCINVILSCLLTRNSPEELRIILVDPKRVELSYYEGIPHLLVPVVKDRGVAGEILKAAVRWMELRYAHLAREGVRDIKSHNRTASERGDEPLPYIVIVIDEFADLMLTMGKEVEEPLARLAQMARAVGIHLVVATQRPSVDVITGIIKANFPVRIAFKVPSRVDSRTILDEMGAEKLLGKGDMLFVPPGSSIPQRLHGPYVSEEETKALAGLLANDYLRFRLTELFGDPRAGELAPWIWGEGHLPALVRTDEPGGDERLSLVAERLAGTLGIPKDEAMGKLLGLRETYYQPIEEMLVAPPEEPVEERELTGDLDPMLPEAARLVVAKGQASATMLQRKLRIGFARAARIMDQLEELGIIEPSDGTTKARKPLVSMEGLEEILRRVKK